MAKHLISRTVVMLLSGLTMGLTFAHVLELPQRLRYDASCGSRSRGQTRFTDTLESSGARSKLPRCSEQSCWRSFSDTNVPRITWQPLRPSFTVRRLLPGSPSLRRRTPRWVNGAAVVFRLTGRRGRFAGSRAMPSASGYSAWGSACSSSRCCGNSDLMRAKGQVTAGLKGCDGLARSRNSDLP